MRASIATITLASISPLTQSRQHDEPKLEGENHDSYDQRTWMHKAHVEEINGQRTVVIPPTAIHQCLAQAAKYSKKQIPGQGKATWTAKFAAGIMIPSSPSIDINPDKLLATVISANADGVRGSGKRVTRRFPGVTKWTTTFDIYILDPIITKEIFVEMVEIAGMFVGVGQFRPQNLGSNGRFKLVALDWQDNRQIVA